jgi:D-amino-acid oxidase
MCTHCILCFLLMHRLHQALPSARITIYADKFGSDLTSHGAAGVWQPYKLSETPEVLTHR